LLSGSFLPDDATEHLRTFCRHRANLLDQAADTARKMQKYLRLLNLRLDVVVNDVTGLTGLTIIHAICLGETNPETLASYRHGNCRKSKEELAKALQSNGRKDFLFPLNYEYKMYQSIQDAIADCDKEIELLLSEQSIMTKIKESTLLKRKFTKR
jgi:hypothetical protein